jgi:predicted nucleic acid-binding protein
VIVVDASVLAAALGDDGTAAYVALAEALQAPLLTADLRLSKAPGLRCQVDLLH